MDGTVSGAMSGGNPEDQTTSGARPPSQGRLPTALPRAGVDGSQQHCGPECGSTRQEHACTLRERQDAGVSPRRPRDASAGPMADRTIVRIVVQ